MFPSAYQNDEEDRSYTFFLLQGILRIMQDARELLCIGDAGEPIQAKNLGDTIVHRTY